MTTILAPVMDIATPAQPRPRMLSLLIGGIFVFLIPRLSRAWTSASLWRAAVVAAFNLVCGFLWGGLVLMAADIWGHSRSLIAKDHSLWQREVFQRGAQDLYLGIRGNWAMLGTMDRMGLVLGIVLCVLGVFLLPYFVILPFGARPGPNRACTRHVARTILLGSGAVHWWGAAFVGLFLVYASWHVKDIFEDYAQAVAPMLLLFTVLSVWTLLVLGFAVRHDYRGPADQPEPHDPWCDACGYILTGVDPAGRCPECGRPIADSLGLANRPPTPWERRPSWRHLRVIAAQAWAIVRRPQALFFSMPTLTGQPAAHRWLLASAVLLFILALPIVPALYVAMDADWNFALVTGSLAMALTWAVFGLMMVGIETMGIATFSRMRGQRIYLATSAKVTAYSAILMIPWIFLGGAQLIAYTYLASLPGHVIQRYFHVGIRGEQVILAGSLMAAHIGGLIWYELTVYRGIRAIQYANQ